MSYLTHERGGGNDDGHENQDEYGSNGVKYWMTDMGIDVLRSPWISSIQCT
jgi:hypothetical protein